MFNLITKIHRLLFIACVSSSNEFIMARYNHFTKIKNKRAAYSSLVEGNEFSFTDSPFKKCVKKQGLTYKRYCGEEINLYTTENLMVYMK